MKKTDIKKEALKLLESLPEYQLSLVVTYLQSLKSILEEHDRKLKEEAQAQEDKKASKKMTPEEYEAWLDSLPEEDEELNEETLKRIKEAEKDIAKGRVYSFEEVAEELGL